jgi:hypothetical protein
MDLRLLSAEGETLLNSNSSAPPKSDRIQLKRAPTLKPSPQFLATQYANAEGCLLAVAPLFVILLLIVAHIEVIKLGRD